MRLDEIQEGTQEADALARKIWMALIKAWAWDHEIKAEEICTYKVDESGVEIQGTREIAAI